MLTSQDYKNAIRVQSACNLSGVVHSLAEVINRIMSEALERGLGTDEVNTHPICKLYADKICDLARVRDFEQYQEAYKICEERSQEIIELEDLGI